MDLGLEGKVAIVTGGSTGIGKATALAFAREGARVAICARTDSILQEAAREIERETKAKVLAVPADVTVKNDIEKFVAATVDRFGTVDIMVNNADFASKDGSFFELTDEDWLETFNIKLLAHIRFIRLVAPHMMERRWGRIINIGGAAARRLMPDRAWRKGATQAGLINLTKKLSVLLGHYGITANVVEPGGVWSEGRTRGGRTRWEMRTEELRRAAEQQGISFEVAEQQYLNSLVIGRRIEADDTADTIVFLASERAATITGEVVVADGGQTPAVRF
jgi:NAD(P)-dependent dehydrogenase (short-subunit alcohol dehydrogenase family)